MSLRSYAAGPLPRDFPLRTCLRSGQSVASQPAHDRLRRLPESPAARTTSHAATAIPMIRTVQSCQSAVPANIRSIARNGKRPSS